MIKAFKTLKDGVFPKPYDIKGQKMILEEKQAEAYVKKGDLQVMSKEKKSAKKKADKIS